MYSISLDEQTTIECSIEDNKFKLRILGTFTHTNYNRGGENICYINSGALKSYYFNKNLDVQIPNLQSYYVANNEFGYGIYLEDKLLLIYCNLDTGLIYHEFYDRMDYIVT